MIPPSNWNSVIQRAQINHSGNKIFAYGGVLERIRSLRDVNFTSDDIDAAAISSNAKGGILKAVDGDKVVQNPEDWAWYNDLWKQKNLGNANLRNRNQFANSDLNANDHNKNFDLGQAAAKMMHIYHKQIQQAMICSDTIRQHIILTILMIS